MERKWREGGTVGWEREIDMPEAGEVVWCQGRFQVPSAHSDDGDDRLSDRFCELLATFNGFFTGIHDV